MSSTANQQQNILWLTQERAFIKDVSNEAAQILTSLYIHVIQTTKPFGYASVSAGCLSVCFRLFMSLSQALSDPIFVFPFICVCVNYIHLKCADQNPPTQWRAEGLGCPWPTRFLQCSQIKIFCFFNHLPKLFILEEIFGMPPLPYPGCPAS